MQNDLTDLPRPSSRITGMRLVAIIILGGVLAGWALYECLGHLMIEAVYEGRSIEALNNLIKFQQDKPLGHYLEIADGVFYRLLFLFSVHFVLICFLYRLLISDKRLNVFWLVGLGICAILTVYILNPFYRVYSIHGFFRGSIVYQILNGYVPPRDPLFLGQIVHRPWGFTWLAAMVSRLFQVSPFYSFMAINLFSLALSILLIYKISQLLIKDRKANILSAIIAIFGTTFLSPTAISTVLGFFHSGRLESRALPAAIKFSNANGSPLGFVFFLLFLYALIKLFASRDYLLGAVALFVSVLGCGFFYAPMATGIAASTLVVCMFGVAPMRWRLAGNNLKPVMIAAVASASALIALLPHMFSVLSPVGSGAELFGIAHIYQNIINYIIPVGPLIALIFVSRKYLLQHSDRQVLVILLLVVLTNAACYLCIHLRTCAEYKYLMLSTVTLGIVGGVAFRGIDVKWPKWAVLVLLLIFLYPSYADIGGKFHRYGNPPILYFTKSSQFVERGTDIFIAGEQEGQLYQWIKDNTTSETVFIDTEWTIPVFARRGMYLGFLREGEHPKTGYGLNVEYLELKYGHKKEILKQRDELVGNIYGFDNTLTRKEIVGQLSEEDVYVVVRPDVLERGFDDEGLEEVFSSTGGKFKVFGPAIGASRSD